MGFADANLSNKNNRKLQRTGNAHYKHNKKAFFNKDIQRSEKPLHDQYNYSDRTPSMWNRVIVMALFLSIVGLLIYGIVNVSMLDVELWLSK